MNCLDCLFCKMIDKRTQLKCAEGHWAYGDGSPRMIKLTQRETSEGAMVPRKFFEQAKHCLSFSDMRD